LCRGLAVLAAALALAVGAAAPAEAAKKRTATTESPRLDLQLRKEDVARFPPSTSSRGGGYAATLPADPWSVLEGHGIRREEAGVPRREAEVEGATEEVVLRRLLEGETIPLLRIKTSPPPRPRQSR
jgi:hypothetical protein